ncbi:MAG: hypothetical protein LBE56_09195 [Tannerella sp.]|jgi:hypothetical protein|nr:hypothetical protein [Tannerella sp.]
MNVIKKVLVMLFAAIMAVVVVSCKDEDKVDFTAEGEKAGTEMCDCVASFTAPNPADFQDQESFQAAFTEYATNLGTCPGLLSKYQDYVLFVYENYNPEAENPLYSVFTFKNPEFEAGFKAGTGDCMTTFATLFALMGGQ